MAKRTLKASDCGSFAGVLWTPGEIRTVEVTKGAVLPHWLSDAKKAKAKGKAKAEPEATDDSEG